MRIFSVGTSGNVVLGNLIGTDVNGTASLGNSTGVEIGSGATANTVGGGATGAANVISGNIHYGLDLARTGTSGNVVLGNFIGTDVNGTAALGNSIGVDIASDATGNTVGGSATGAANVISGNIHYGLDLVGTGTSGNVVLGNKIGADVNGTTALGDVKGVAIAGGATANTLGGIGHGNLISGNSEGVYLSGATTSANVVRGNLIGTDVNGTASLENTSIGIYDNAATANTIGGTATGAGNVISGNPTNVYLKNGASANVVLGNLIGTDINGTVRLANDGFGVLIENSAANTVGGAGNGAGNLITPAPAAQGAVFLRGPGTSANVVAGNRIGTDINGAAGIGGVFAVVILESATANTIGGTATGSGNVISSSEYGVYVSLTGTNDNVVLGNLIGTDASGHGSLRQLQGRRLCQWSKRQHAGRDRQRQPQCDLRQHRLWNRFQKRRQR